MADAKSINQLIAELPQQVQDYIFDENSGLLNEKIIEAHGLTDDKLSIFFGLLKELFVQKVKPARLHEEVIQRFGIDREAARKLARDIAGYRLLPLDKYLGDIDGTLRNLGGDPAAYPKERIKLEIRTTEQAIEEIVQASRINALSHRLKGRLHDVINSYLSGVRTENQLYEILTRPEKTGGIALEPVDARLVVDEAREERETIIIREEDEKEERILDEEGASLQEELAPQVAEAIQSQPPVPKKEADSFMTILPEDEEEIETIKRQLPKTEVAKSQKTDEKIKASVEELYQASGIVPPNEEMQNRLRNIIENRLRDIRDQLETLEILAQPKELGGMSLSQVDARRVISLIENKLQNVHVMHAQAVTAEKRKWVEGESAAAVKRVEDEKKTEAVKREEAHRLVVSKSKKAQAKLGGVPAKPAPKPAPAPGQPPTKLPVIPSQAKPPKPAPPADVPPQPAPTPKPPATIVRPAVKPPMPKPPIRPKVQDVKFTPKLTGPFEEIQKTTLEDFRRLSKDPREAALKIKDKIDLQAEESFDNKMKAVSAWNISEIYKIYLEMMKEALEGKPMSQVISEREQAKKPALTQEEVNAIIELGTKLRY